MQTAPETPVPSATPTRHGQIFISYSRKDNASVGRLFDDLKTAQYLLWMDTSDRGIEIGDNWRESLRVNMTAATAVIACLSPDFLRSPYCKAEILQAATEGKKVYPVLLRPLDLKGDPSSKTEDETLLESFRLTDIQFIDLHRGDWDSGVSRLKRKLPPPNWTAWLGRYGLILAAALAVIVIGGLGLQALIRGELEAVTPTITPMPTATPVILRQRTGIAVAYFALDESVTNPSAARELIDHFAADLQAQLEAVEARLGISIGYLSPEQTGEADGDTRTERRDSARALVRGRGVDVIVYGVVSEEDDGSLLIDPEFTLIPEEFASADELTGGSRFGSSIHALNRIDAEQSLTSRANAMALIIDGLAQFLSQNYDDALVTFELLPALDDYAALGIDEVVRILIGNTQLRLAALDYRACDRDGVLGHVEKAIESFSAAAAGDAEYSRPYSGLAAARFLQARWLPVETADPNNCPTAFYDIGTLYQALADIDRARAAQTEDDNAFVNTLRAMNEARITLVLCDFYLNGSLDNINAPSEAPPDTTPEATSTAEAIDDPVPEATPFDVDALGEEACSRFEAATARVAEIAADDPSTVIAPYAAEALGFRGDLALYRANASEEPDYDEAIGLYTAALDSRSLDAYLQMRYLGYRADAYYYSLPTGALDRGLRGGTGAGRSAGRRQQRRFLSGVDR